MDNYEVVLSLTGLLTVLVKASSIVDAIEKAGELLMKFTEENEDTGFGVLNLEQDEFDTPFVSKNGTRLSDAVVQNAIDSADDMED